MILYHGSNMVVEKLEINAGRRALDFVVSNRKGICESSLFDIIVGPVANDSTMPVIDDYMDGRYTKEEAIEIYSMSPLAVFDMWESEKVTGNPRNSIYIRA